MKRHLACRIGPWSATRRRTARAGAASLAGKPSTAPAAWA